ncbi:Uma2 family endonuclease [Microbacterium sp.]|uniref:Uma2 family endonuclease n=1 Tax=Microbacterium sp. TaxID=51671 RepID=UPI003C76AAAA
MTAEAPTFLPYGRDLTRADLDALPDDGHRYELIDGALIVTPAPRIRHQVVLVRLFRVLDDARADGLVVLVAPVDVVLSDSTVMQPDVLVAPRADFTEKDLPAAPLLAVEILSPSTRGIDLLLKKDRLERAGCQHYWVVDPDEPSITAWDLVDGRYRQATRAVGDEEFAVEAPLPVRLVSTALVG